MNRYHWPGAVGLCWCFILLPCGRTAEVAGKESSSILFGESFEDPRLLERGWYDGSRFTITDVRPFAGKGCVEYAWKTGGTTPASSSGVRRLFEPSDTIVLRCYLRLSEGWGWTGRNYHPHLMHFMTKRIGPSEAKN